MPSPPMPHDHTPEAERAHREAALDETIEGSFPASDPLSSNPNPDAHPALERNQSSDDTPETDDEGRRQSER